jgi:adenosylcobinamide hydrolase
VPMAYRRDDPDAHLETLARGLGLVGPGIGHLTGVDVHDRVRQDDGGAEVWATVGLGSPVLAAAPDGVDQGSVGTVNIIAFLPVRLADAALVNAVLTATEAKAQALFEMGLAATGTATDAVTILCSPDGDAEAYGGPRSRWGARLARAVHAAVLWQGGKGSRPWSDRHKS